MKNELQQSALDVISEKIGAVIASACTIFATGISTYLEVLPSLIGSLASSIALILGMILTYGQIKKGKIERQILYMQRDILAKKELE